MNKKIIKCMLIILSIVIVLFTLNGKMITSSDGGVPLIHFESMYLYIFTILMSLYMAYKNHKYTNIAIIITLLTYIWTYYLVQKTINYFNDPTIVIDKFFYIYLASSAFLIIALFINQKEEKKNISSPINMPNGNINNIDKDNLHFAKFIMGLKGIPYNTDVLLVNNIPDNTLDFIYVINNQNQTFRVNKNNIKNISYQNSIKVQNNNPIVVSNETKSMLLSAAVFGGSPLMQLAGNGLFESIMDDASGNYQKVELNASYEITVLATYNEQEIKLLLSTDNNPNNFINKLNNK